jgi:hypothetical protein
LGCESAPQYIAENFEPSDRLAVVLLNKRTGSVMQRIASAERIAAPDFQAWLTNRNSQKDEIYISMNALREDARGRTKSDIQAIKHLYLDFDENGTEAVDRLIRRQDLPLPNYQISSSPGKWHVVWKVEGFTPEQAEQIQKSLASDCSADPAATDSTRVLRLPGFYNHKYDNPHLVWVDSVSTRVYCSEDFRDLCLRPQNPPLGHAWHSLPRDWHSQSERDWAYAKRALARGDPVASIVSAIANYRRDDKSHPEYYAALTVQKAAAALAREQLRDFDIPGEPER